MPPRRPSGPPGCRGGGGSLADSGTRVRDKQAVRVKNALGAFLEEAERAIGSSCEAPVRSHDLEMANSAFWARRREVVNEDFLLVYTCHWGACVHFGAPAG